MTITTNDDRDEYTASSGQTVFNYTFKIYESTDLNVYQTPSGQDFDDSADIITAYTVSGVGSPSGGTITLTTGATSGDRITIVSDIPSSRTTDYQVSGDFLPATVNEDFDRIVSLQKQAEGIARRSLLFPQSQQNTTSLSLPSPTSGSFLKWKADLSGLENHTFNATGIQNDVSVQNYVALRALTSSTYSDGQIIYVTDDGVAGEFVVKTGTVTDNGGTLLVFTDDSNRYAERLNFNYLTLAMFGGFPGNTATDSSAAMSSLWAYLRSNPGSTWLLDDDYMIDFSNLTPELASVVYLVADFDFKFENKGENRIYAENAGALWCFQFGCFMTAETRPRYSITSFRLWNSEEASNTTGCENGVTIADTFQGNAHIHGIECKQFDTQNIRIVNTQDIALIDLKAEERRTTGNDGAGIHFEGGTPTRANSSGGSIVSSSSAAANTNLAVINIACQNLTDGGVKISGATNTNITFFGGYAQSNNTAILWELASGAGTINMIGTYSETSAGTHNDITVQSAFTGRLNIVGHQGSSVGARARLLGGVETTWQGIADFQGGVIVDSPCVLKTDGYPQSGFLRPSSEDGGIVVRDQLINNDITGTTHTLDLTNLGSKNNFTNSNPVTLTVPPNSTTAFEVGVVISCIRQASASLTVAEGSGVTVNRGTIGSLSIPPVNGAFFELVKVGPDEWDLINQTEAPILATTAELTDITDAINTTGKYQGKMVHNTSTGGTVWAESSPAAGVWNYSDGTTAHTPV